MSIGQSQQAVGDAYTKGDQDQRARDKRDNSGSLRACGPVRAGKEGENEQQNRDYGNAGNEGPERQRLDQLARPTRLGRLRSPCGDVGTPALSPRLGQRAWIHARWEFISGLLIHAAGSTLPPI